MKCSRDYACAGLLTALVLMCDLTGAAEATSARLLTVTNSQLGTFEVVSHRMEPVAVGAIAGGLVGAAVESGIHSSQDQAMKKRLLQSYPEASCDKPLLDAFSDRIRASGTFSLDGAGKAAAAVDIEIAECGLHLADSTAFQYASYVYLKLKVKPDTGAAWSESIQISGRNRFDFEEFVDRPGLARTEVEDALKRAGTRAADKIIYKK